MRPTYPRLPNGIFGRIDDMITIRGENVYPSEIDAVLNGPSVEQDYDLYRLRWQNYV